MEEIEEACYATVLSCLLKNMGEEGLRSELGIRRLHEVYRKYGLTYSILNEYTGVPPSSLSRLFARYNLPAFNYAHRAPGTPKRRKKRLKNERAFHEIDSEVEAYLLGFLIADGKPLERTREGLIREGLELTVGCRDEWVIRALAKLLGAGRDCITYSSTELGNGRKYRTLTIRIYSTELAKDLAHYGVVRGRTAKNLPLPDLSPALQPHFVRGLIDGDGWITRADVVDPLKGWQIGVCGAPTVIVYVRDYAIQMGLRGPRPLANGSGQKVQWHGIEALKLIDRLYAGTEVALPRKREVAHTLLRAMKAAYPGGVDSIVWREDSRGRRYMSEDGRVRSARASRLGEIAVTTQYENRHPTRGRRRRR